LGGYEVIVDEGSARLTDGTLAGSLLTMDAAVRNLMAFTGCTLGQAAACASLNPAALLGLKTKGRLAVGMDADLVVLDAEEKVVGTVVMGQVAFSRLEQLKDY
jgi:N-acetylglucosamine-6-phosphate deacetylase